MCRFFFFFFFSCGEQKSPEKKASRRRDTTKLFSKHHRHSLEVEKQKHQKVCSFTKKNQGYLFNDSRMKNWRLRSHACWFKSRRGCRSSMAEKSLWGGGVISRDSTNLPCRSKLAFHCRGHDLLTLQKVTAFDNKRFKFYSLGLSLHFFFLFLYNNHFFTVRHSLLSFMCYFKLKKKRFSIEK